MIRPMAAAEKASADVAQPRASYWTRGRREAAIGYVLLLPNFVFLVFVIGYPLLRSIDLSFKDLYLLRGFDAEPFVGLQQYIKLLQEPRLLQYLKNQAIWTAGTATLPLLVGLVYALLLNRPVRLRWLWRVMPLIPWATPIVVTAMSWRWMLDGEWGIVNYYLQQAGLIDGYVGFLLRPETVWPSILLVSTWYWFPFNYVCLLAALQKVPQELYDAGRVDGTNAVSEFWDITLPLLRPTLGILLVLGMIWAMNDFTTIWVLTQGGPGTESTTMAPLIYRTTFEFYRLSYGAAIGVILMLLSLSLTALYLRSARFEVD